MEKQKIQCDECGKYYINVREHITKTHKKDIKHHDKKKRVIEMYKQGDSWYATSYINGKKLTFVETGSGGHGDDDWVILDNLQNEDMVKNKKTGKMEDRRWEIWFDDIEMKVIHIGYGNKIGKDVWNGDEFEVNIINE